MKVKNLLLEIGTEELPASFIDPALNYIEEKLKEKLSAEHIPPTSVETFGTPRRLIAIAYDVPEEQPRREELIVGPSYRAAFDENGNPTRAAQGFAKSRGVTVNGLLVVENPQGRKGKYVAVRKVVEGKRTEEVLKKILPEIILSIPFKKSMRWGEKNVRFARPIRWIVSVFGDRTVEFEINGIKSSNVSYGHRFLSPEPFQVESPNEFLTQLEDRFVVADLEKRKAIILDGCKDLASSVGGKLLEDEELLEEVTNLTEFPYPILGKFDGEFLNLPKEVPITVMKDHQKFFSVVDREGNLKNYFIGVSNIKPTDDLTVRLGYEKVLKARLSDALFFFKEDRKRRLEERVPELQGVVFHEKLGTMLDKTKRLVKLTPFISEELKFDVEKRAERAAYLSKADLLTEMVNEFPELQGTMGKYYALLDGEDEEVALSIEEQYLPRFSKDRVAETKTGISLSLSEKIDNLTGFIGAGLKPTGSADPFALRRNALGLIQTLIENELSLNLTPTLEKSEELYEEQGIKLSLSTVSETLQFIKDRLKNYLREKGFRPDTVDAVLSVSDNPYDSLLRVKTVEVLRENPEFEAVLFTMRRVVNIIPVGFEPVPISPEGKYEEELWNAFLKLKGELDKLIEKRDYRGALLKIGELKPFVDNFFDNVMVMDKDEKVRNRRLSLLKNIADKLLELIDFSKIVF